MNNKKFQQAFNNNFEPISSS